MAMIGKINVLGAENDSPVEFRSKGLTSGANFAFGGEAGDHEKAIGGSKFLRQYATEEDALAAVTARPKGSMTQSSHIYVEDVITPEAACQLITRQLLIKDYPTGIYSDYPITTTGSLPPNNCGTIVQEQKAVAGIAQNILALAIPTTPEGVIEIPAPEVDKADPAYYLLQAIRNGLNAQYAVQWAEGTFNQITQNQDVKLSAQALADAKEMLKQMFVDAYFGLHAAGAWQQLFVERDEIKDEATKKAVDGMLTGPVGQLALLRPPTHVFNIVKAALAYQEFLKENDTQILDVIKTVQTGTAVLKPRSSDVTSSKSDLSVVLYDGSDN